MSALNREFFERYLGAVCTAVERTTERTVERLIERVILEVRTLAITMPREDVKPAAPHDADAEQGILSALLSENTTVEVLKPLESPHFYGHFNQKLYTVLSQTPTRDLQSLADAIAVSGPVLEELTQIRDATVFCSESTARVHMRTVVEHWRKRELIRVMQTLEAQLRVGVADVDGARDSLREFFMGTAK